MQRLAAPVLFLAASAGIAQTATEPVRVFFDWAKPELTRDATAELDKVAADYAAGHPRRIDIAGHTDRSGPSAVNLAASRRRAEAVRDYLAGKGVPRAVMRVGAFGESRPLVPTEDGVREVQNRRVEIRFAD